MRISAEAMNVALKDLEQLRLSPKYGSAFEAYLVGKRLAVTGVGGPQPVVADVDRVVSELFTLFPDHPYGRLRPFRWAWNKVVDSGRSTVWNTADGTGATASSALFVGDDIRRGLKPDATAILAGYPIERPSREALVALLLRDHPFAPTDGWAAGEEVLLDLLGISAGELDRITDARPLGVAMIGAPEWSAATIPTTLAPSDPVAVTVPPSAAVGSTSTSTSRSRGGDGGEEEVVLDARTERMLRRAVARFSVIVLIGPPGTGKGTLIRWISGEVARDPAAFGFRAGFDPDPLWRTPDESWTSLELVGNLAPDPAGVLRWANGLVPTAISEDRWLVLDETNRADMDKIMGPLLTWLSDTDVEIGRHLPHGGEPIQLGWTGDAACVAEDPAGTGVHTTFLAGRDWRMFGTYNPHDAQRVFRLGQALSRRFVTVPIPAIDEGRFAGLLSTRHPGLDPDATGMIVSLYTAHRSDALTVLGPAVFLRMAAYLDDAPIDDVAIEELVAEAYVLSVGKYLAAYDDQVFEALGRRVTEDDDVLPPAQWAWVAQQRDILG